MTTVDPSPAAPVRPHRRSFDPVPATDAAAQSPVPVPLRAKRSPSRTVRNYVALTKPRIIELLLVTTLPTMVLAEGGLPSLNLVLATLLGGTLAAGSANALNCYLDRDIDKLMNRTVKRPLATGEIEPRNALVFGLALGALSIGWLAVVVNVVSALLTLAAILLYVVGYTMILKRRTPQNIVWGGAAGCMPVLIGWSAVTGSLSWAPVILFGIIFLWTPPHYWPLSMKYREDYAAAGVPMLAVVREPLTVANQVVAYSWAMVLWSLLLWPVAGTGLLYPIAAGLTGAVFLREAHALRRRAVAGVEQLAPMRLFHWSITYLTLLFVAIALDPLLRF